MARKVAHEVKNPLTPIAISVADLKRSYELQRADFPAILDQAVRTVGEEVESLKKLLQEFSEFARLPVARIRLHAGLGDLSPTSQRCIAGDVAKGRLQVSPPAADVTAHLDAGQIRQALVNLVQNGLEAIGPEGRVAVSGRKRRRRGSRSRCRITAPASPPSKGRSSSCPDSRRRRMEAGSD